MRTITILLIEDNPPDVRLIRETLKDVSNFKSNLISVLTLKEGCEQIQKNNFDIILLDLNLPDSTGQQTFQKVIDCNNEIPVVLITGMEDVKLSLKLILEGAQDYITKQSLNPNLLGKSILYSIERQALLSNIKLKNVQIDRIEKERILLAKFPSQNPDPILRVAGNGKLLYINEAGIKLLSDWQLIINEIIPSRLKDIIDPIFIEGTNIKFELCHREFIYSFYAVPVIEEGYINLYGRDITERKRAEDALSESEERYRKLFENHSAVKIILDLNTGAILDANDAASRYYGWTREEMKQMKANQISTLSPIDVNTEMERVRSGRQIHNEFRHRRADGSVRDVEVFSSIIEIRGKDVLHSIIQDITERKRAEDALRESEERHRTIIQTAMDGFWMADMQGRLLEVNETYCRMSGYSTQELLAMRITDIEAAETADRTAARIQKIKSLGEDRFESRHRRKDGSIFDVEVSIQYQFSEDGRFVVFIKDISERKRVEQALIIAKEHAEESDRLKSAFLANMSHEIRTPMNGILGFAELLKEPDLTGEQQQKYLEIIEKSGERMLNIINDIISISKIESGQMGVSISELNINEQIEYIHTFFKPEVEQKGLQISYRNTLPAKEAIIKTDREKIYAILTNLVKNAIKFTKTGSIEFGYEKKGNHLQFSVTDTGIGIRPEQLKIVFERFRQGSESLTRNYEGAGLGLSISKAYVEMLGGKIWVESEIGKGSTLYFTLPYDTQTEDKIVSKNASLSDVEIKPVNKLKILIAEDDKGSEMILSLAVEKFSKNILKARTGIEAVETCRNNTDIDLVLMDMKMPEMDGYEATRHIRHFNKDVVIIAQTAFALSGDREKSIAAGCNDHISKPIKKDNLMVLIQKYFKNQETVSIL